MVAEKIIKHYFHTPESLHIINQEQMKLGYAFMASINSEWANL